MRSVVGVPRLPISPSFQPLNLGFLFCWDSFFWSFIHGVSGLFMFVPFSQANRAMFIAPLPWPRCLGSKQCRQLRSRASKVWSVMPLPRMKIRHSRGPLPLPFATHWAPIRGKDFSGRAWACIRTWTPSGGTGGIEKQVTFNKIHRKYHEHN